MRRSQTPLNARRLAAFPARPHVEEEGTSDRLPVLRSALERPNIQQDALTERDNASPFRQQQSIGRHRLLGQPCRIDGNADARSITRIDKTVVWQRHSLQEGVERAHGVRLTLVADNHTFG